MATLRSRNIGTQLIFSDDLGNDIVGIDTVSLAVDVKAGAKLSVAGTDITAAASGTPADGSVTAAKLAAGAVTAAKIGAGAVLTAAIGAGQVVAASIGALAVGTAALAAGAVTTAKIAAANITTALLAAGAVTLPKQAFGFKVLSHAGVNGAGAVALAGTVVGDRVVAIFGAPTAGGALAAKVVGTDFESVITVVDQIQQVVAADLSASTFVFIIAPAAA